MLNLFLAQMNHPSYLLNPGDMFQVDPDCVMLATGKKKPRSRPQGKPKWLRAKQGAQVTEGEEAEGEAEAEAEDGEAAAAEEEGSEETVKATEEDKEQLARRLKFLSRVARQVLGADKSEITVKKKQRLRTFIKEAREVSSKLGRKDSEMDISTDLVGSVNSMLKEMILNDPKVADRAQSTGAFTAEETAKASGEAADTQEGSTSTAEAAPAEATPAEATPKPEEAGKKKGTVKGYTMSSREVDQLSKLVEKAEENPVDESKPYATPWEPRPYMSPFAFIPRYLEVNQNICAAVYLRHPVARRGFAEVPSPFPPSVMQLAFNWYLRRR